MKTKEDIKLYEEAFSVVNWKNEDKIKELLQEMGTMSRIIAGHLEKIKDYFPQLTDHSLKHSDILWEYADIIVGRKKKYLNPLEAFILNSAFLLHDAGMCYSLLFKKEDIKKDQTYLDYIKINNGSIDKDKLEEEALFFTVRENHGSYAMRIVKELLPSEEYFISSIVYRDEFADFIGKIAKSHTCNINYIEREFGTSYTSPSFPKEWSIDFKKIAYILRVSDAADIDNMRTPKTIKIISEIKGESKEHWSFQKKLGFPTLEHDGYLIYSTNNPFTKKEQKAWWYCYNALKVLDDELKNANSYFTSKKQDAFEAKSVKYINDTLTLGRDSIKTIGWDSINTSIRVSNPVHIAAELGGKKLYGNVNIAVRELIQNSIDAIHVYRALTMQDSNLGVGKIKVSVEKLEKSYFLIISDNGIGMSQNLLTNELLDFGGSYWKTNKFYNDFKGLPSKGFEAIGKYGIGFFSSFMLGTEITITSWKYGESIEAMRTLEFYDGLMSNPILRLSTSQEKNSIIDRGTTIKIKLQKNPYEKEGIIFEEAFTNSSLKSLVQFYVPSADVEISVTELDGTTISIAPNTIEKLNLIELIDYLRLKDSNSLFKKLGIKTPIVSTKSENAEDSSLQLIEIIDKGKILGKLTILPNNKFKIRLTANESAVILAKGIRVGGIEGFAGYIITNEVVSIKRDQVLNVIPYNVMRNWATVQLKQIEKLNLTEEYKERINDIKITFNFHDDNFTIAKRKNNNVYSDVSITEFKEFVKKNNKLVIYSESDNVEKRAANCDGFINVSHGLNMNQIIIQKDLEKINHTEKIIRGILKKEWKEYDEAQEQNLFGEISGDEAYDITWTFTKKKLVKKKKSSHKL